MGILDSIVEWIATQVMNLLDLITGSVLGALGCDMSTFLRYFPAAETLYEIFVAIGVGFILLNLVWQLFRNFGLGLGLSAEDPVKLAIKSILFIFLALFADQIIRVEMESDGRAEIYMSDGTMFRCDHFDASQLYGTNEKKEGATSLHLQEELRYDQSHSMST